MKLRRFVCVVLALTFILTLAMPVAEAAVAVKSILLDVTKLTLEMGQTPRTLKVTFKPAKATNKNVTWTSADEAVAKVDESGAVTPVAQGRTIITCTTKAGKKTAKCEVTVVKSKADLVTYRVFSVANANYKKPNTKLASCVNDQKLFRIAYNNATFGGMTVEVAKHYTNQNRNGMLNVLRDMRNCGADANDVTVFYYSGHGTLSSNPSIQGALLSIDGYYLAVNDLRQVFDMIPGKVIVILDSCFSGKFINDKGIESRSTGDAAAFNQAVVNVFASPSTGGAQGKSLTDPPSGDKYKIITAASPDGLSWGTQKYGLFSFCMGKGIGCAYAKKPVKTKLAADVDGNNIVTLTELFQYVDSTIQPMLKQARKQNRDVDQTTMMWPANDQTAVIARTPFGF